MVQKIQMATPIVEMDGDEMTRILWKMIKDELILPFIDLKTEYYDLGLVKRDETADQITRTPPVQWIYPLIFSDMSIGALSTRAWEAVALAVGYLNEKCGLPVRMSSGEGGEESVAFGTPRIAWTCSATFASGKRPPSPGFAP